MLREETFAVRPDGGGGTFHAGTGTTTASIFSTRSLGGAFTSGTLDLYGWIDSRSNGLSADGNISGLGLATSGSANFTPAVWIRYRSLNFDELALLLGTSVATSGDADGTAGASPTYLNTSSTLYNQWQHVRLELDLTARIARMYKDAAPASSLVDTWVQVGSDVSTGALTITHASIFTSRDGVVDDLLAQSTPVPEPSSAVAALALAIAGLLVRRRRPRPSSA